MIEFLPAGLYFPAHLTISICLTLLYFAQLSKPRLYGYEQKRQYGIMLIYAILFIVVVGLRPISGHYFGDTVNYARSYESMKGLPLGSIMEEGEWIFNGFMWYAAQHIPVQYFFLIIEILYVVPLVIACKKLVPNNPNVMLLFCMTAFSFFTYGTNGIRNGMACSLIILALAFMKDKTWKSKCMAILLAYIAFGCHKSTALPILCMVICLFFKNTKYAIYFWLFSIFVSLVAGNSVESFFTSLGFDDRMSEYSSANIDASLFSSTGFRWDFLLYSFMPILLGWYIVVKRRVKNNLYSYLLNSYIFCNAFWVMMIRASYSNRFAYLSWFIYPIVLAYPLLKFPVFKQKNNQKVAWILLAHTMFTLLLSLK